MTVTYMFFFAGAHTQEVEVLQVYYDHNPDNNLHKFILNLDEDDNVHTIIRRGNSEENSFTIQELQTKEMVISMQNDKKVILFSCPHYDAKEGGPFIIKYLHNGFTNSYKELPLWLSRGESGWQVTTPPPEMNKVNTLNVVVRKIAGLTIGVQRLQIVD